MGRDGVGRGAWVATSTVLLLAGTLGLAGCGTGGHEPTATGQLPEAGQPAASAPAGPSSEATEVPGAGGQLQPIGTPRAIATDLDAPWSMVRLGSGSTLVSERDTARILELEAHGTVREVGSIKGVHAEGEAGLLGLAVLAARGDSANPTNSSDAAGTANTGNITWLYAYFTAASDNRVARMPLHGDAGSYSLGKPEVILRGIPKASNHDGGRIKFGPDGMLYVTTGDASSTAHAQNVNSLGGKILRLEADGQVPPGNPFAGSYVYSWGHRNPQGITWTSDGTMWASEFGQNTWDELNIIIPGGNYGWPAVEGEGGAPSYIDPVLVWPTSEASPSAITAVGGTLFMAGLGGQRLWVIDPDGAAVNGGDGVHATAFYTEEYGRIRDVVPGPDASLWFMTNNTDGRGSQAAGDDKIYQVQLGPAEQPGSADG